MFDIRTILLQIISSCAVILMLCSNAAATEHNEVSKWGIASAYFFVGFTIAMLIYFFCRNWVEKLYEIVSRSQFGNFLPQVYHRDSIADRIYGYYLWDRRDGFEMISPYLKNLLRLDDFSHGFETLRKVLAEDDFRKLRDFATKLRREEINEFRSVIKLPRGNIVLECIGLLRNDPDMRPGFTIWFRDISESTSEFNSLKQENEALRHKYNLLQRVCEQAPFPVWMRDENLNITYCNHAYADAVEDNSSEITEPNLIELDGTVRDIAEEASNSGLTQTKLCHVVSKGKRRLFRIIEMPVSDADKRCFAGFAIMQSELEDAEAELKRYVSAQADFLESSASAMAVYGADMKLKSYNNAFVNLWKLDEAWLDNSPAYGDVLEALREKRKLPEQANFLAFKRQNIEFFTTLIKTHEEYYYLPDGRVLRVIIIPHALGGLMFAYEDVTDRLALERNYNTLIAVQRATLDHLQEGVAVFGEDGRLRLYNSEFASLLQLDTKMLSAEPHISDVIERMQPALHISGAWTDFRDEFRARILQRSNNSSKLYLSDGKVLNWFSMPLPDGAVMLTLDDITDSIIVEETLRDKNRALEEADRVKTEFLASMSYELRSPLTSIMGFSEALNKNYFGELNAKQHEYMEAINGSSHRLMALINNILDLASIEAGYMKLSIARFNVRGMLEEVAAMQAERLRESGINLVIKCDNNFGDIEADEARIKQILFNLLHNAIKFSDNGKLITIGVENISEDKFSMWVEDHGDGMSKEDQAMAFERFYRGSSVKARKSGAGLGLSMVKRFTELHSGTVKLSSIPGQGTKVTCILPKIAKQPA